MFDVMVEKYKEGFKTQFDANKPPSHLDLQCFLDLAGVEPSWPVDNQGNIYIYSLYRRAIEETLEAVITELTKIDEAILPQVLNANMPSKKSLVVRAAEFGLISSLAFLLSCGATLGRGMTPKAAYRDVEAFSQSRPIFQKVISADDNREVRNLLDRSTVLLGKHRCKISQYAWAPWYMKGYGWHGSDEVNIASLQKYLSDDNRPKAQREMLWIDVSSTNVSVQMCVTRYI
jgi:hypothetical protein